MMKEQEEKVVRLECQQGYGLAFIDRNQRLLCFFIYVLFFIMCMITKQGLMCFLIVVILSPMLLDSSDFPLQCQDCLVTSIGMKTRCNICNKLRCLMCSEQHTHRHWRMDMPCWTFHCNVHCNKSIRISKKTTECSICLGMIEKNNVVATLVCQHIFHDACLSQWKRIRSNCPLCRQQI